jgi:hypothetical protein
VDVRVFEDRAVDEQQGAVDPQLLPVVALAERLEEGRGLAGAERDPERVAGLEPRGGLLRGEGLGHCRTLLT